MKPGSVPDEFRPRLPDTILNTSGMDKKEIGIALGNQKRSERERIRSEIDQAFLTLGMERTPIPEALEIRYRLLLAQRSPLHTLEGKGFTTSQIRNIAALREKEDSAYQFLETQIRVHWDLI